MKLVSLQPLYLTWTLVLTHSPKCLNKIDQNLENGSSRLGKDTLLKTLFKKIHKSSLQTAQLGGPPWTYDRQIPRANGNYIIVSLIFKTCEYQSTSLISDHRSSAPNKQIDKRHMDEVSVENFWVTLWLLFVNKEEPFNFQKHSSVKYSKMNIFGTFSFHWDITSKLKWQLTKKPSTFLTAENKYDWFYKKTCNNVLSTSFDDSGLTDEIYLAEELGWIRLDKGLCK